MGIMISIKHKDKLYRILRQTCQNDESYNVSALTINNLTIIELAMYVSHVLDRQLLNG